MNFGKFDETDLFHIEDSKIYKEIGSGIKTVEFILNNCASHSRYFSDEVRRANFFVKYQNKCLHIWTHMV